MMADNLDYMGQYNTVNYGEQDLTVEKQQIEQRKKREEASFSDQVTGMWYSAQDANTVYNINHYIKYKQGWGEDEDKEFLETFDPYAFASQRGFNIFETEELAEAKNKNHLMRIAFGIDERKAKRKFSAEVNTQAQTIGATLGGAIFDLNIPIAGAAYKVAKATGSAKKGLAVGTALDTTESLLRYATHDKTEAIDVPVDVLLSTAFNLGAIRQAGKETEAILRAENKRTSDAEAFKYQTKQNRKAFFEKQKDIELNKAKEELDKKYEDIQNRAKERLEKKQNQTKEEFAKEQAQKKAELEKLEARQKELDAQLKERVEAKQRQTTEEFNKELKELEARKLEIEGRVKARLEKSQTQTKEQFAKEQEAKKVEQNRLNAINKEIQERAKKREQAKVEKTKKAHEEELKKLEAEKAKIEKRAKDREYREKAKTKKANEQVRKENEELKRINTEIQARAKIRQAEQQAKTRKATEEISENTRKVEQALKRIEELTVKNEKLKLKEGDIGSKLGMKERAIYKDVADEIQIEVDNIKKAVGEKEAKAILQDFFKDTDVSISAVKGIDGFWDIIKKDAGKVKKVGKVPIAIGAALAGTSAMASDGDELGTYDVINGLLLLAVAGYTGSALWRGREGTKFKITEIADKIKNIYKRSENLQRNSDVVEETNRIADLARTGLFETYQEIAQNGTKFKELAKDLLYNFEDTVKESAEVFKQRLQRGLGGDYAKKEAEAFEDWLDEMISSGEITKMQSIHSKSTYRVQFREKVTDIAEGLEATNSEALKRASENYKNLNKSVLDYAKYFGVEGAESINASDNYVTRLWHKNSIKDLIINTDEAGKKAITDGLARAIYAKNTDKGMEASEKVAEAMIDWFTTSSYVNTKHNSDKMFDEVFDYIKTKYGEADAKELSQVFVTANERIGRFKHRIEMDLSYLDNIQLNIGGVPRTLTKKDFVERDAFNIVQTYLNQMGGAIGLAKNGWKSEAQLDRVINELSQINPDAANKLIMAKDLVLGRPIVTNPFSKESQFVTTLRNAGIAMSLPLVAFSTGPELLVTVSKAVTSSNTGKRFLKEVGNIMKEYTPDDEMMEQLSRITGRGNAQILQDNSLRGVVNSDNIQEGIGFAEGVSGKLRDGVIKYSQLPKLTDIYERTLSVHYATVLAKYLDGKISLKTNYLKQYGITNETKDILKDVLKLNPNGNLKKIGDLTIEQENELGKVINAMVNSKVQHATIGGSPLYFQSSNVGRLFGVLMSFGLNAYSNLGLRGLINKDAETFITSAIWFAGAYMGVKARAIATGQELEEEDAIKRAVLNLPLAGPLGVLGAGNAPTLQIASNVSTLLDLYRD